MKIQIVGNTGPCDVETDLAGSKAWKCCPRQCGCQAYKNDVYLLSTEGVDWKYLAKVLVSRVARLWLRHVYHLAQILAAFKFGDFLQEWDFLVLATWRSDSALSAESSNLARQWHSIRAERSSNGSCRNHRALEATCRVAQSVPQVRAVPNSTARSV